MPTKNKIPVALDRSNINSLFGLVGGYGTVVTVGIIAMLSVCAAFFIYRSFKGKRRKGCEKSVNESSETEGESTPWEKGRDDDRTIESTEGSEDGGSEDFEMDSSEAITLSTANTHIPSELSVEDLRETIHKNLTAPPEDHPAILVSDVSHQCTEDHMKRESGVGNCDAPENVKVQPDLCEDQHEGSKPPKDELEVHPKENVLSCEDESDEAEPHGDVDEPSETESAQEMMEAKTVSVNKSHSEEDLLGSALSTPEVMNKVVDEELLAAEPMLHVSLDCARCSEVGCKTVEMDDLEAISNGLEKSSGCCVPQEREPDCCGHDKHSDLPSGDFVLENGEAAEVRMKGYQGFSDGLCSLGPMLSSTGGTMASLSGGYEHFLPSPLQSYLGFATPSLVGEATLNMSGVKAEIRDGSKGGTPALAIRDKNEINIMEAIMDSNEWLSTGPPETRDLPWLTQSNTSDEIKINTSSLTPTSNSVSGPSTDISLLNSATTTKIYEEEDQSRKEKIAASMATPEDAVVGGVDDEDDLLNKRVAAVSPMPQLVQVSFRVHYITWFQNHLLAVTGSLRELGAWDSFVPLQRSEDGFWAGSVTLPAESHAEWKFVLVEDGKIRRWEECGNRHLVVSGQEEEIHFNKSWGYL